ncbi:aspartoacylase isoform X1 [Anoplopoma fimbria]|uniref:aspartoacylase isoform X1 n=2 Tax=Anoplopoma fimbria TaxID=229290 RepID=UPI0023EDAF35|nr:aspartoacylase isoform X1 [Anoplopoma fimbria]
MTGVHTSLTGTQSDATSGVDTVESRSSHLGSSPSDYMEKISRYLESSVGQSRQDKVSNGPSEAESDSGDSLFLTQKEVTLPEAVRSRRGHHSSRSSNPKSARDLEESEDSSSSSSYNGQLKTHKWRKRSKYYLPKYSFPFLEERKWKLKGAPLPDHNKRLHNYTIGGFFKCLGELRQSCRRGQNLESSLPTIDMDGEHISPLSEEDQERSEDEDIKVVDRKLFMVSSKTKSQQTWCNQLKKQRSRKANNAGQETSGGRRAELLHKKQIQPSILKVKPKSSDAECSGNRESSCRVLVKRGRNDENATKDKNLVNDSGICEPRKLRRSPRQATQKSREASKPVTEQPGDGPGSQHLLHRLPDHRSVTKEKKRKKDLEGRCAATVVNMEVEEPPGLSEGNRAAQTSDVLELTGRNGMEDSLSDDNTLRREEGDIPDSKQKNKPAADSVGQEVDGNLRVEDSVFSMSCNMEDGGKKKTMKSTGEDVEQLQCDTVAEPLNDGANIQKKRKSSGEDVEQLQSGAVAEPLNDGANIQKKKKSTGEDVEQLQSGAVAEPLNDGANIQKKEKSSGEDVEQLQYGAVAEPLNDGANIQKKEKKKKSTGEDVEQLQSGAVAEPLNDGANIQKKEKKKRKSSGEDVEQLQSGAVAEPLNDGANKEKKMKKSSGEDVEQLQYGAVAEPLNDGANIQKKKKKKKSTGEDVEQLQSGAVAEPLNDGANIQKKKKKKSTGEDVEQLQYSAVAEPLNDGANIQKKKKKKSSGEDVEQLQSGAVAEPLNDGANIQKKRKSSGEDVEQLQYGAVAEPLNDGANIQKKKKKKRKVVARMLNSYNLARLQNL